MLATKIQCKNINEMPTHVPSRGIHMCLYPTVDAMFLQVNKAVYTVHRVWLMWL